MAGEPFGGTPLLLSEGTPRRGPARTGRAPHRRIHWSVAARRFGSIAAVAALLLYTTWPWLPGVGAAPTRTIVVYGFSILGDVMTAGVFPAFQDEWEDTTGEHIEIVSSFAGSGTITNQIVMGVPAQVAILSLELDALRLVDEGRLDGETWHDLPHGGIVTTTPFIALVRPGNPKGIESYADLAMPGVGIVHPDPLTSGGAQWAILGEYASALKAGGTEADAYEQLLGIWRNVVAQASSARAVRTQFEAGFGDALITYEQEAVFDEARGKLDADIVYLPHTILSENLVVVVERNIRAVDRDLVDAFVDFLWSGRAQEIFVEYGFRSVDENVTSANGSLPALEGAFTVDELGGWPAAKADIVEAIWKKRVLAEVDA